MDRTESLFFRAPGRVDHAPFVLAEMRLAIWDAPSFLHSPSRVMQMQIDQPADEVFELIQCFDNRFSVDRR